MSLQAQLRENAQRYDAILGSLLPKFTEEIRSEADHAVQGEIYYNDGRFVAIGRSEIRWVGDQIDDHVWRERPKRFLYLPPLMAAYLVSGEESYAEAARDYVADWMRAHPASADWRMPSYDNSLNLAIRVAIFAEALPVFCASAAWDEAFLLQLLNDIDSELRFISVNLSPKGNFRMKQAMTLIECGLRFPFRPDAAGWRRLGVEVMNDAARRQVLPDGAHVECTAGYHIWMTRLFRDCLMLGRADPDLGFTMTVGMVAGMFEYALANTRPNGTYCGLHDIEGAWEGVHENESADLRSAFLRDQGLPETLPPTSQVYPHAGQAFLRDDWGTDATFLTFDATRLGSAHGHLSRNAIQLHAFGRSLIVDPGRIVYEMRDPLGPYCKSTRAHSTVNLNGWNQFTTNPDSFRSFHAPGYDCVSSKYSAGYWQGKYGWWFFEGLGHGLAATHTRHLFWVHGRWAVVIDEIVRWDEKGRGTEFESPNLELNWQLSPGKVEIDATRRRVITRHADANLLLCFAQAPANAEIELHEGGKDPHRGWIRDFPRYAGIPSPQVSLVCRPWQGHVETLVTLLVPYRGTAIPQVETEFTCHSAGMSRLTITSADGTRETVSWLPGLETMLGDCDEGRTDGLLLYRRDGLDPCIAAVDATISAPAAIVLNRPQQS